LRATTSRPPPGSSADRQALAKVRVAAWRIDRACGA
jgi:hypothetical protein